MHALSALRNPGRQLFGLKKASSAFRVSLLLLVMVEASSRQAL